MHQEMRKVFTHSDGWGEKAKEEEYFMIHKNDKKLKFQCPRIKFYWHTAPSGHLRNACGCSHELHSYSRNHKANAENINSLALYRKCVPVP